VFKQIEFTEFVAGRKVCRNCGKVLNHRQASACSKQCAAALATKGYSEGSKGCARFKFDVQKAVELYKGGKLLREIAEDLGTSKGSVSGALKRRGVFDSKRIPKHKTKGYSHKDGTIKDPFDPNTLIVEQYRNDAKILRKTDSHWSKHKAVNAWMAHWKDKRLSAARAKLKYKRYKNNPDFKILKSLRHRLWFFTTNTGTERAGRTMHLVGCGKEELRMTIESKFKDGMGWHNYGRSAVNGWEIDHIIPCTAFDLTKPEEQRKCFHYSNLQPMWKDENIVKGGSNRPEWSKKYTGNP
jgi:hypothetical protein